ncbi:MAG: hemerythrin domain-containing protein [Bacteroidales bacterium]|jgi:regulator of cell morphogenesis and NO signaling|nr:hemerythrin domain-containing protein [Bacteroidales bacterium]
MNKTKRFSEKTKLAELIANNGRLLQLLPRFGIALGFGDRNIGEVCRINNVSIDLFLNICYIYSDPDYKPSVTELDKIDMRGLLSYLKASHRYYMDERFPHIEEHLQRIIEASGYKYGPMLSHFYEQYKQEVVQHIQYYEEEVVFPYIEMLNKGQKPTSYNIEEFRHNHTNIQDTLDDMMNILVKYLPGDILPAERIEISLDIMELSADLNLHSRIEDHLLIPFVETLENTLP